jgi:histidine triad (HIT) family protein
VNPTPGPCVFCEIVAGNEPAEVVRRWVDAIAIVPIGPVVDGHLLVIPTIHVRDASESPYTTGQVMARAAEIARPPFNIITSAGREATQSVFHLHAHIVPRAEDDGLALPWYSGKRKRAHA